MTALLAPPRVSSFTSFLLGVTRPSPAVGAVSDHTLEESDFFLMTRSRQTHKIDSELVYCTVHDHCHIDRFAVRNTLARQPPLQTEPQASHQAPFSRAVHGSPKLQHETSGAQPCRRNDNNVLTKRCVIESDTTTSTCQTSCLCSDPCVQTMTLC